MNYLPAIGDLVSFERCEVENPQPELGMIENITFEEVEDIKGHRIKQKYLYIRWLEPTLQHRAYGYAIGTVERWRENYLRYAKSIGLYE